MNKLLRTSVIITAMSLIGCMQPEYQVGDIELYESSETTCSDERPEFILECIKNGNPMSDEEPEDLVEECSSTSWHLFCESVKMNKKRICIKEGSKYDALFEIYE